MWPHARSSVKSCDRIFKLTTRENTNTTDAVRYTQWTIKSAIWDVCYWSDSTAFHCFVKVKAFVVGLKKWCELVLRTSQELLLTFKQPRDFLMIINSKPKRSSFSFWWMNWGLQLLRCIKTSICEIEPWNIHDKAPKTGIRVISHESEIFPGLSCWKD